LAAQAKELPDGNFSTPDIFTANPKQFYTTEYSLVQKTRTGPRYLPLIPAQVKKPIQEISEVEFSEAVAKYLISQRFT
jgi:hypothetical protein